MCDKLLLITPASLLGSSFQTPGIPQSHTVSGPALAPAGPSLPCSYTFFLFHCEHRLFQGAPRMGVVTALSLSTAQLSQGQLAANCEMCMKEKHPEL